MVPSPMGSLAIPARSTTLDIISSVRASLLWSTFISLESEVTLSYMFISKDSKLKLQINEKM